MGTFPIVRRQDGESAFGSYRTRDMVLAYMNALAAGDVETEGGGVGSQLPDYFLASRSIVVRGVSGPLNPADTSMRHLHRGF